MVVWNEMEGRIGENEIYLFCRAPSCDVLLDELSGRDARACDRQHIVGDITDGSTRNHSFRPEEDPMSESTTLIAPATAARKTTVEPLFEPVRLGRYDLPHRMVMRSRGRQPGSVPSSLNACYYAQRASAALIVTE